MKIGLSGGKIKRTYRLEAYQVNALKLLSEKTRIKQVDYVREVIDNLISKYQKELPENLIN
jgi:hypothetical protein